MQDDRALIFDIKRDSSEDGPGIRTTVFFKGCPLACSWCHNPEGKNLRQEQDVHDRTIGEWIMLDELLYRLLQDKPIFISSGGGITLSGGEPMMQMGFAGRLLQQLKQQSIHTAIETSGFFHYDAFRQAVLPWVDLIYFDLKLIDDDDSRLYCGRSNQRMLSNFSRLLEDATTPVIPRIPLIPDITTTASNLRGIAALLNHHGLKSCSLMPYNPLWRDKMTLLGLTPAIPHRSYMSSDEQAVCARYFTDTINRRRSSCR